MKNILLFLLGKYRKSIVIEHKKQIWKRSVLEHEVRNSIKDNDNSEVKEKLIAMFDYYMNYASDRTRISSTRSVAAEVAKDLEKIIKSID